MTCKYLAIQKYKKLEYKYFQMLTFDLTEKSKIKAKEEMGMASEIVRVKMGSTRPRKTVALLDASSVVRSLFNVVRSLSTTPPFSCTKIRLW